MPRAERAAHRSEFLPVRIMIVTNAGWDAVDPAASGAQRDRRAGLSSFVSEQAVRRRTTHVADGKTVWSWHPLLVSSRRRCGEPDRVRQNLNPPMTVTRRIRRRGERGIHR